MNKGPQKKEEAFKPTAISDYVGAGAATLAEQVLHPLDTLAKNAMRGHAKWLSFKEELEKLSPLNKVKRVYKGVTIAVGKKGPMRAYKFATQAQIDRFLETRYSKELDEKFGPNASLVRAGIAGAITGACEVIPFQPIDTLQIRQQNLQEKISLENVSKLGLRGLYRGAIVTAFGRNVFGATGLFAGSEFINKNLDNQHKKDHFKNFLAKWGGALFSIAISQPGDKLKVMMQTEQISLKEAWARTSSKELFSDGLKFRLYLSFKIAIGFFIAEKFMDLSARFLGEPASKLPLV